MRMTHTPNRSFGLWLVLAALWTPACATNPYQYATTPELKAYTLERTYNVALAWGVTWINSDTVGEGVKQAIRDAEKLTTPVVEALVNATAEYVLIRSEVSLGQSTDERLLIAANNLEDWILRAERAISAFASIARPSGGAV